MAIRPLIVVLPVALALGLAACDSRDYEAEIAELQTQLGDANSELETLRGENQSLTSEMTDLRTQAEQTAAAAGNLGEEVADKVRGQLESALDKASQTADRLAALEREPDAPADTRVEAVGVLRGEVQEIVDALQAAADDLGLELQGGGVEPAAGASGEAAQPAAGGEAGQAEPAPQQPADQPAQPKQ